MSNVLRNEAISTNTAVDAFMTISTVYLTSVERLSALNLNTVRETYVRGTSEIMTQTCEEISKVFARQLAQPLLAPSGLPGWNTMSDMFAKGVQQINASLASNIAGIAGAKAKAVSAGTADARKAGLLTPTPLITALLLLRADKR